MTVTESPVIEFLTLEYQAPLGVWYPLLSKATRVGIRRGGSADLLMRCDLGTLTFVLLNDQDPLGDGALRTGLNVRAQAHGRAIFTGKIIDLRATYPMNKSTGEHRADVVVEVVDAVNTLRNSHVRGSALFMKDEEGNLTANKVDTLEERLTTLAPYTAATVALPPTPEWVTRWTLPAQAGNVASGWSYIKPLPGAVTSTTIRYDESGDLGNTIQLQWTSTNAVDLPLDITPVDVPGQEHVIMRTTPAYGIQKTITGLVPGKVYAFTGKVRSIYNPDLPLERQGYKWAFAVDNAKALASHLADSQVAAGQTFLNRNALPVYFKARSESATLRIYLGNKLKKPASNSGAQSLIHAIFYDLKVIEMVTSYPQRLAWNNLEGPFDEHLDLAANSVAASWHVTKDNVVTMNRPSPDLPISFTFSDEKGSGVLEYVDIEAALDTRQQVNFLEIHNQSYGPKKIIGPGLSQTARESIKAMNDPKTKPEPWETHEETYTWRDEASIEMYGPRAASISTNLALAPGWLPKTPHTRSQVGYEDLLDKLTGQRLSPRLLVSKLRWNAQQNTDAASRLEIGQRVLIKYRGFTQDALIAGLDHDITPSRWMIDVTLARP